MPGALFLEGDEIDLRTIERKDTEFLRDNINDPDVRKFLTSRRPVNMQQEENFFEEVISSSEDVHLAICRDEEIVGMISLEEDEKLVRVADISLWIATDHHRNGYGTEAAELITEYGFRELGYHKISARAYKGNTGSNKIWEKLGFTHEGTLRKQALVQGEFKAVNIYGVLEKEWKEE